MLSGAWESHGEKIVFSHVAALRDSGFDNSFCHLSGLLAVC